MDKKKLFIMAGLGVAILATILVVTLNKTEKRPGEVDPEFVNYISAFTSGIVSNQATIRIRLSEELEDSVDAELTSELFSFDPGIEGSAVWLDKQTIEFTPAIPLKSGQLYEAEFFLSKLMEVSESKFETFVFHFQVIKQSLDITFDKISTYDNTQLEWQIVEGSVTTADVVDISALEKTLSAKQKGNKLKVKWTHASDKVHAYRIDSVHRTETADKLLLAWDGDPIDSESEGELEIEIPALGDFKIMQTRVHQQPQQYISIVYSDPLDEGQNLNGMLTLSSNSKLRMTIEGNEIKAFPSSRQSGTKTLTLYEGIRNVLGYKTKATETIEIRFEDIKPALQLVGDGVIIPANDGLKFPFKCVNLKAVKVKIIRIYEDNVAQFLQVNQLNGQREIKRVGRVVHSETVDLTTNKSIDYGKWNTFYLDLDKMLETEPGAIYRVMLSFTKKQSLYPCADSDENNMEEVEEDDNWDEDETEDYSYWGGYEDYYYYDDYNYQERENPCHNSFYYGNNTSVSRNILASDLGIIAKRGSDKKMTIAITDLKTTEPVSGVELEVLNYQQQLISTGSTDGDGMAQIDVRKRPYLLVAKKGPQRGYLRLDDGSSLSLSKFDVSGAIVQKGIKGFIYGERGVWRPGDSLFLNFMLEDKQLLLPKSHPVRFELINPEGQIIKSMSKSKGIGPFYNFNTNTEPEALTGNWTARVKVGGATFSKILKIEAIKPNRLKINLDFGVDRLTVSNSDVAGKLLVKWLHGAIAKNLKTDIRATITEGVTQFKRYKDYRFDDPARSFESDEVSIFDGRLNQLGEAQVQADIAVEDASPGMLKASFLIKVFEEGGDFSVDRFTIPYAPYESFVGIKLPKGDKARGMLLTDKDHSIEIATVDADGNPVSRNGLEVSVYKATWRWWWENTADNELARYVGNSYNRPIVSGNTNTKNGTGSYKFQIKYPDWGRYYVRVYDPQSGHSTGQTVYIDWPGWAGRAQRENPGGASMLTFSTDKEKYTVGDKAEVIIPSTEGGRALVSIESGSKVIKADWVQTEKETTRYSFKVTADMSPNVFVNVSLVQPHNTTANDLPIRLYGVVPMLVEDPDTKLYPKLSMPDELQPEQKVTIKVNEENSKAMNYTIAIVDEGLLDLTRFKTPDPWSHFYAREALGVKTWDMYDMVMGAYTGEIAGLLALGGDGEIINKDGGDKANRFKPMVKFLGPFELTSGNTNTHTFTMPQYVGSVRTMLIAGKDNAYGHTEKTTPVRQPLMVLATLPRVAGPGETLKLPVTVFAMGKGIKNVSVEVKTNDMLKLQGSSKKSVSFSKEGDQMVDFELKAPNKLGVAKVQVIAKSGKHTAKYDVELDVRNPNPPVTNVYEKMLEAGETWNTSFDLPGMVGTNKATLELSSIPPINLEKRLRYLIRYPHGCVEQTTSSGFPQLYLSNVVELDAHTKTRIKENIVQTINRLQTFQVPNGGFVYWPGYNQPDDWGSSYAGHFLLEAKSKGYTIPSGMIDRWTNYQLNAARNWRQSTYTGYRYSDFIQAYRLFTLALANKAELGAMNRLKEKSSLSLQAKWRLAAAYELAGQSNVANEIINALSYTIPDYKELSYSYGSNHRDHAMILETLVLMGKRQKAGTLLKKVAAALSRDRWMSTQTTAYSLIAVSKFIGGNKTGENMAFTYSQNGKNKGKLTSTLPVSQQELDTKAIGNNIKLSNNGGNVLFARIITEGVPITGDKTNASNDLVMSIKYKDLDGNTVDPSQIGQGMNFKAEVTLKNPGHRGEYKEMALTQIFPSGWEIHNTRMDEVGSTHMIDQPSYMDIRNDRAYYYFDLKAGESKTFVTLLNASYLGKYYLPTIYSEAMYDNTINARKAGRWVNVVRE